MMCGVRGLNSPGGQLEVLLPFVVQVPSKLHHKSPALREASTLKDNRSVHEPTFAKNGAQVISQPLECPFGYIDGPLHRWLQQRQNDVQHQTILLGSLLK